MYLVFSFLIGVLYQIRTQLYNRMFGPKIIAVVTWSGLTTVEDTLHVMNPTHLPIWVTLCDGLSRVNILII